MFIMESYQLANAPPSHLLKKYFHVQPSLHEEIKINIKPYNSLTSPDCIFLSCNMTCNDFNVAKCHSMRVTRHQHHKQILFDYSIHNQTLENVQSAKYLGITISDNMDWGQHILEISSKATKTLGFLRRNLACAPRSSKEVAYKTFVRPKLEYAAPIWSPYSKLQINQVEKVQRTAARLTCRRWRNTSSVGEMLDELEWPSLEASRDLSSLLLFHKIQSGAVSIEKRQVPDPCSQFEIYQVITQCPIL